jgi:hypothetical protein
VLRLISSGKVTVSDKTRYPNTTTLKAIASLLQGGDYYDDEEMAVLIANDSRTKPNLYVGKRWPSLGAGDSLFGRANSI